MYVFSPSKGSALLLKQISLTIKVSSPAANSLCETPDCVEHSDQNQLVQLIFKLLAGYRIGLFAREVLKNFHVLWADVATDK